MTNVAKREQIAAYRRRQWKRVFAEAHRSLARLHSKIVRIIIEFTVVMLCLASMAGALAVTSIAMGAVLNTFAR